MSVREDEDDVEGLVKLAAVIDAEYFSKYERDLIRSLYETILIVEQVLNLTFIIEKEQPDDMKRFIGDKLYLPDLRLIESKSILTESIEMNENEEFGPIFL